MENVNFKEWLVLNEARYGNYCGPGPKLNKDCSALADGSPLPQPINSVDKICQAHDIKYCQCGSNWTHGLLGNAGTACSRGADKNMQAQLDGIVQKLTGSEKLVGTIILRYFQQLERGQRARDQNGPGGPPTLRPALA